jgi:toxic protein SymE
MKDFKKLKIHSKHRPRTWDNITVPEIRLEGKWLDKLGFKEGRQVQIEQQKNKLIITLNKTNEK